MKTLFDASALNHLQLKNRLIRSATWEALAKANGEVTEELHAIYEELAKGGVGTIVTGCTDISEHNNAADSCMRLYCDDVVASYRKMTDAVHKYDCNILVQLNMDEYVKCDPATGQTVQVDFNGLTAEDMAVIRELYVQAALRAEKAGFDGVMIHTAYGYLLNRSLNPQFNHRTDNYGGTPENRARFAAEVYDAVRAAIPNLHMSAKVSFYYKPDGSLAVEECAEICGILGKHGLDSLEIGGQDSPVGDRPENSAIFLPLVLEAKKYTDVPMILVGGHRNIDEMEKILNESGVEYFSMSRPLVKEPDLPARWQSGDRTPSSCVHCSACFKTKGSRCIRNPGTTLDEKRIQFAAHVEKIS